MIGVRGGDGVVGGLCLWLAVARRPCGVHGAGCGVVVVWFSPSDTQAMVAGRPAPIGASRRSSAVGERVGSPDVRTGEDVELLGWAAASLNRQSGLLGELGGLFADAGHELYLVGGSVRDALLDRLTTDLDFTTDARPDVVQRIVRPWADALWDTGIAFGTVGIGKAGQRLEITTFRSDSYDQVSRNPGGAIGDRLEDDLVRRDFTANAMAVRITPAGPGEFLDPLGGLAALRQRILDTPTDPRCPSVTTR